ncbi:MAG: dihydrolipoyl dehydrogenase [Actinomycetes bacterium]
MTTRFDLVILGGGPGGYAAALYGAAAGLSVALVEELRVGGTCLHRGCIPAKELLQTAEVLRTVKGAKAFGVGVDAPTLDLNVSIERQQKIVDRLTKGLETLLSGRSVNVFSGRGEVLDAGAHTVRVDDGTLLEGGSLIIATGSSPREFPGIPFDGVKVLSSDHVLALTTVPARTAIIGGGAIGCEFASYLADVGSTVTVLESMPSILPGVDTEVAEIVGRMFKRRRITVRTGVTVEGAEVDSDSVSVRLTQDNAQVALEVDAVVVSIGRTPNTVGCGFENSGIEIDPKGFIQVDGEMQTSVAGVYAVGDVVATPQLAHVAFAEAIVAIKSILGESPRPIDYTRVPWGIYCHPEVAFCGPTEAAARAAGQDVVVSVHRFAGNARAQIMDQADGLVKVIANSDGVILGVHIVGPMATELLGPGYLAVNWEATVDDLSILIQPHPTLGELFGESVLALTGRSLHA